MFCDRKEENIVSQVRGWATSSLLVILRLSLAMWVGAAVLFVITSVAEQTSPHFDSLVRDQLATIRFPYYYQFGFVTQGTACLTAISLLLLTTGCQRKRVLAALVFTAISVVVMTYDYQSVYLPLQKLIIPPGQPRSQEFTELHVMSRNINIAHVCLALWGAIVAASQPRADLNDACPSR